MKKIKKNLNVMISRVLQAFSNDPQDKEELVDMLNGAADQVPEGCEVVVSPVALHIPFVQSELNARYAVACQNIGKSSKQGAFTGDICADQIVDFGLRWTLVGHSERRSLSGETDEDVAAKVRVALDAGVKAVLCIGEQLAACHCRRRRRRAWPRRAQLAAQQLPHADHAHAEALREHRRNRALAAGRAAEEHDVQWR